jgi:hypothetical protein
MVMVMMMMISHHRRGKRKRVLTWFGGGIGADIKKGKFTIVRIGGVVGPLLAIVLGFMQVLRLVEVNAGARERNGRTGTGN